ncbi:MAG: 3-phosphoshikimate 1-carboxyvinyltransferase [Vicinamibacteria bacterium]|nr:3-phosphoshikimate 1-carboxyvinyltransferase [Vicinamibacteria bacterium]
MARILLPAARFEGRFRVPGDKSVSHRAAILAALAHGPSRITGFSPAADCASTLSVLRALGVPITAVDADGGRDVEIDGRGPESWRSPAAALDCGNSGSTMRMLAGALAGLPIVATLDGDASLRRRPMGRIALPLRAMGATVEIAEDGTPPLRVSGGALRPLRHRPAVPSAQVKTAVLLAGLSAAGETWVEEDAATRDHTERLLPLFGVEVLRAAGAVGVSGPARPVGAKIAIPGDASSAAFLVVAALTRPGSVVRVERVLLNRGRAAFLEVLRRMGGDLSWGVESESPEPVGWIEARGSRLHGIGIEPALIPALIDEIPALCVAAARAVGRTEITGAGELRVKESDRLAAMAEGLSRLGLAVEERPDGLALDGRETLRAAELRAHGDHRIAMALGVAALSADGPCSLDAPECAAVSFPGFFDLLERGARRG